MRSLAAWVFSVAVLGPGCDKEAAKPAGDPGPPAAPTAEASASSRPEPAPEPPRAPTVTLDDHELLIDGVSFVGSASDWKARAVAALVDRRLVAGESVAVSVMRDAKTPKVEALVEALAQAKARAVVVHTPTRDQSVGELVLTLGHPTSPDCAVVSMIEHDGSVAVWTKSGGVAQRFTRGMAGPDLSSSTDALRKRASGCDAHVWYLSAAENIQWGLAFDLALRAKGSSDAGSILRPKDTTLLTRTATPGRRATDE